MDDFHGAEIAIIGMSGRFPGARNLDEFWRNLRDGVESLRLLSAEELATRSIDPALLNDSRYVKAAAVLEDSDLFDANFFGMSHREAELTDPQHRLFLECAWEALEDAGYSSEHDVGAIGVFAGASPSTYLFYNLASNPALIATLDPVQLDIGNSGDYLTTRVSYKFNLKGPSHLIQSACSTSLVAVHVACQSLLNEECDIAVVGGITVSVTQPNGYIYLEGGIASPDGHCRAFDAAAQGTIFSSGVGVVVLKRLDEARAAGDTIHAVIKGSAINNDGALKVGYTAPSVVGQAGVISEALANAGVATDTIGYIEAHGTGTAMGDPIEIQALTQAFRADTSANGFCALGSLKTNIGHLGAAAGIAGLIKVVLALKHKQIPPSLHFTRPNPEIDFANSPFFVATQLRDWPASHHPRRAGVSSFGVGGTNAHLIVEEAPAPAPSAPGRNWQLLTLSAKSATALETLSSQLAAHLRDHPELDLADVAHTLQVGRRAFNQRRALLCRDRADAIALLNDPDPARVWTMVQQSSERPVVFLFPGQGAQYAGMGQELYQHEPIFRQWIDRCAEMLRPQLDLDLRAVLYPELRAWPAATVAVHPPALDQTWLTQPALFVVEYALAQLWMDWGVQPHAMIGHSIGEYVAACLAGVFTLEDALTLVAMRGKLMQELPGGAMLAVQLPVAQAQTLLGSELSLAAVNGVDRCVLAGPSAAIAALHDQVRGAGVNAQILRTSHAFHSAQMEPILERFAALLRTMRPNAPRLRFISNVSGTWISPAQASDPQYWATHLRATVRFADGLATLLQEPGAIFLELGPGTTLGRLTSQHPAYDGSGAVLAALRAEREPLPDQAFLLRALGQFWLAGGAVNWPRYYRQAARRRVPLPTYPFERRRYWVAPAQTGAAAAPERHAPPRDELVKHPLPAQWCYQLAWQQADPLALPMVPASPQVRGGWLVFAGDDALSVTLLELLQQTGQPVLRVAMGAPFTALGPNATACTLDPDRAGDYAALLANLRVSDRLPGRIVYAWSLTTALHAPGQPHDLARLLRLLQALGELDAAAPLAFSVLTSGGCAVTDAEPLDPAQAALAGLCRVVAQEHPQIAACCIDIGLISPSAAHVQRLLTRLLPELAALDSEPLLAYRGAQRWLPQYPPLHLQESTVALRSLREQGVYLIVGGLSGLGFALARHLASRYQARLLLLEPAPLPPRDSWAQWLAEHPSEPSSQLIRNAQALESSAGSVTILSADLSDVQQLRTIVAQIYERYGALHGVVYAAGSSGAQTFRFIQASDPDEALRTFDLRVQSLVALEQALQGQHLDFVLVCSSLATVLGGVGYAVYAAAGCALDALVQQQQQAMTPWLVIDWDAWQFAEEQAPITSISAGLAQLALDAAECGAVFERVVTRSPLGRVVISTGDLALRMAQDRQRIAQLRGQRQPRPQAQAANLHPRPKLLTPYVAPGSELEQQIAAIWQQALGIAQIGVNDNFFELGGDSFIALHVVAQLKQVLDMDIPVVSLYEGLSIRALAGVIQSYQAAAESQPDLAAVEEREDKANRRKQYQQMQRTRKRGGN